ncbi:hypothetical protein BIW11_08490 [Tropilaelaps mercedesae]|uniref:Uncharacterized protein n=1 Tax=Tropilaelaps mercedesae TaxID=418985 RepID=A0A1V9XPB2_9ACAR|nr:hypothetical protein BIW11_08490 [Tropilaelaps mercedesae]
MAGVRWLTMKNLADGGSERWWGSVPLHERGSPLPHNPPKEFFSFDLKDADLIEILWKQDVDLGIPLEDYRPAHNTATSAQQHQVTPQTGFPAPTAGQAKAFPTPFTALESQQPNEQRQHHLNSSSQYFATSAADKAIKKGYEAEPYRIDTETGKEGHGGE